VRRVLQNRSLQVRFLSHLPEKFEFIEAAATWNAAWLGCFASSPLFISSHLGLIRPALGQIFPWKAQQHNLECGHDM
jgi:hypothetical protein